MKVEILGLSGCPNYVPALKCTQAALESLGMKAVIYEREIGSDEDAIQARFLGSPSIRVNDLDVEVAARRSRHFGLGCRTYVMNGQRQGLPPQDWIEDAIREAITKEAVPA
jgi:hypothetical protein